MEKFTTRPPADRLRDVYARVGAVGEALDCGDVEEARGIIADLEGELAVLLGENRRPFVCRTCTLTFRWPGELERHGFVSGHGLEESQAA